MNKMTALEHPKYAVTRKQPTSLDELIHNAHVQHMTTIKQEEWIAKLFRKADRMKAQQERKMYRDLETLYPTGARKQK